jgi:hypothetical protein
MDGRPTKEWFVIWRYVPGSGWILQPLFPAASGCIVPSNTPRRRFGFRGLQVAGGLLALFGLGWLAAAGFWVEVATEVLVAVAVGALGILSKNGRSWVRQLRRGPSAGGGRA